MNRLVIVVVVFSILITMGVIYLTMYTSQTIRIIVSSTTSLYSTGLLDYIGSVFEREYPNVKVIFIPVGSGQALKLAERGDACATIVHSPPMEKQYLYRGAIEDGVIFAYNYFVIVGPRSDPAGVRNTSSSVDAFKRILDYGEMNKLAFISRGDGSGTHIREISIWRKVGVEVLGRSWYLSCGCSMDQALIMANEKNAYALSDRGTYLSLSREGKIPNLEVLYDNNSDIDMLNIYSIYVASKCSGVEREYALKLVDYLHTRRIELLRSFKLNEYNTILFFPVEDEDLYRELWSKLASSDVGDA